MNVLSYFDGMSCGQLALRRAGIKVDNYFACEIKEHAIAITQENFPHTIQLGDVTKVLEQQKDLSKIDLFIGGGKQYFDRRDFDDRNLVKELRAKNYLIYDFH